MGRIRSGKIQRHAWLDRKMPISRFKIRFSTPDSRFKTFQHCSHRMVFKETLQKHGAELRDSGLKKPKRTSASSASSSPSMASKNPCSINSSTFMASKFGILTSLSDPPEPDTFDRLISRPTFSSPDSSFESAVR
jgi:hypothetical protein